MNINLFPIKAYALILLVELFLLYPKQNYGQTRFSFEFLPGGAITLPSPLTITQSGQPNIKLKAQYRNENFTLPLYYSWRLSYYIKSATTVELELNHLKIILKNLPAEIERFSITHGYNQLWINGSKEIIGITLRGGLGAVLAHPESTIRGETLDDKLGIMNRGYYLCGITSQIALQKKIFISKHLFLSGEIKANGAYAKVPVVEGHAHVPVYALHAQLGIGIKR